MGPKRRKNRNEKEEEEEEDFEELSPAVSDAEDPVGSELMAEDDDPSSKKKAKEHMEQLQRLQEKDPDFYQYLKDFDKELLEFNDEEFDEDEGSDMDDAEPPRDKEQKVSARVITSEMVDFWFKSIKEGKLSPVRSILQAFRTACHYGDDGENDSSPKLNIISSGVFNKIMVIVLNEMDGILRGLLDAPNSGGKKETILEITTTKQWKKHGSLMRIYLGNALCILTQMTDEQMISFTLKRVKASAVFLGAFPSLLRKYVKVALHTWGTGKGALPVVSFLFLRDLCVRIGSDCLDTCLKGVYKAYVFNCKLSKSVSRSKLQHINFLGNCITELYGVDLPTSYQHAFVFIRQLATILRGVLTERGPKITKDKKKGKKPQEAKSTTKQSDKAYQKVYDWQVICCLELWTSVICAYNSEADFRPLAYPLTQIISGVASLVPTARYLPFRLRCIKMLNRIAAATGTFIPVSSLLLDMLEMKELNRPPTGGIGKAINLLAVKQLDKTTLKTRAFQEACIFAVVEELTEHLAQWSYSFAFFELSFIPLVRLRSFCKSTKVDKFRREIKELIQQVDANCEFTNARRMSVGFSLNDPAAASLTKVQQESGESPLSQFAASIRLKSQQRIDSMVESSVLVGTESAVFGSKISKIEEEDEMDGEEGAAVFSSPWMPEKKPRVKKLKSKDSKKRHHDEDHDGGSNVGSDEDVVEDLVLSSDEEDDDAGDASGAESLVEEENGAKESQKQETKQKKSASNLKRRRKPRCKKRKQAAKP